MLRGKTWVAAKQRYSHTGIQIAVFAISFVYLLALEVFDPIAYTWSPLMMISLLVLVCLWGRVSHVALVFALILFGSRLIVGPLGGPQNGEIISSLLGHIVGYAVVCMVLVGIRNLLLSGIDSDQDE